MTAPAGGAGVAQAAAQGVVAGRPGRPVSWGRAVDNLDLRRVTRGQVTLTGRSAGPYRSPQPGGAERTLTAEIASTPTRRVGSFGPFCVRRRIIPAVTPPVVLGLGLAALAVGALVLRSFGGGYRIGRFLSATPRVTIAEALAIAVRGEARHVAVAGRLDSETEFEDEHHRPLVFRRIRIEVLENGRWRTIDEQRRAVDFEVREGLDAIAVDHAALDEGLVVIPRESTGSAGEVASSLAADLPPDARVRIRVDQVSSVEHAIVIGIPIAFSDGSAKISAGLGRPLILSTLERDEAMRILAGGSRARPLAAAVGLGGGLVLLAVGLGWALLETLT